MRPEDWLLLIAPRPMLGIRGSVDAAGVVPDLARSARHFYDVLGAPELFEWRVEPGGHEYFVEPALRFFDRHLARGG